MFGLFKKNKDVPIQEETREVEDFSNIDIIAEYFKNETGVCFDKQISILKNKLVTFCKHRNILSFTLLLQTIKNNKTIKQELIDTLTTNETFFYREFDQISKLVNIVKEEKNIVSILCAPSATGEEPYSIAIALLEAGVSSNRFSILGIDINSDALEKAQNAIYRQRNVRMLPENVVDKYFTKIDDKYSLNKNIRSLVTFKLTNLFDKSFSEIGKFDFVFSRNMLIYFDNDTKQKAKRILEDMRKETTHPVFFGHADLY